MNIASRYLAIVRLATWMPFSFKKSAILLSLSGLAGSSLLINSLMIALNGGGRAFAAAVRGDMAGEEVLEFVNAVGRVHVFLGGDARDGGLVQLQLFGNVTQHHGLHRHRAVLKEGGLLVNNGTRHPQQGVVAAVQAFDEPAGFLQVVFHAGVVAAGCCWRV